MTNDKLLELAKKAADELFHDMSVSLSETRRSLSDLQDHISILLDSMPRGYE